MQTQSKRLHLALPLALLATPTAWADDSPNPYACPGCQLTVPVKQMVIHNQPDLDGTLEGSLVVTEHNGECDLDPQTGECIQASPCEAYIEAEWSVLDGALAPESLGSAGGSAVRWSLQHDSWVQGCGESHWTADHSNLSDNHVAFAGTVTRQCGQGCELDIDVDTALVMTSLAPPIQQVWLGPSIAFQVRLSCAACES